MYCIYFLINELGNKTYTGFTDDLKRRIKEHHNKKVHSTRNFIKFRYLILEEVDNLKQARIREKYWKSCAGRKKLEKLLNNNMALSPACQSMPDSSSGLGH